MNKFIRIQIPFCFLLLSFIFPVFASAQKISGKVLNEGGRGASHVTVQFDKANSVFTDVDGNFTIVATRLPDTLFFFAPGFEPYKVNITGETVKDPNFEIVLLNTRRKVKSSEVVTSVAAKKNNTASSNTSSETKSNVVNGQGKPTSVAESYLSSKKLFMIDTLISNSGPVIYKSGLLTAGELNDFDKWKMWRDFGENEFKTHSDHWGLYPLHRYSVQLQNKDHSAMIGKRVFLIDKKTNDTAWSAVTDNTGKAELWADIDGKQNESDYKIACNESGEITAASLFSDGINKMEVNDACSVPATVDIAMVVDATGSMSGEIDFLKIELEHVIRNTFAEYHGLDLHVGSVFYRDKGDEYVTRSVDFQTDLLKVLNFIKLQRASGGGDVPEAVDLALKTALDSLHWSSTARSRILFLVTDAPPHDQAKEKIFDVIQKAAAKGVRIVPVICNGADRSTEFIMRCIALATNGTFVFLTNESNGIIQNKPGTDVCNIQFLNSVLERIIKQMVLVNECSGTASIEISGNIPANIENINIYPNPSQGTIRIESKNYLKEVFVTDFTGKILMRIETKEKQNKWVVDLSTFPKGTFLIKYITGDDQWGAEKFSVLH